MESLYLESGEQQGRGLRSKTREAERDWVMEGLVGPGRSSDFNSSSPHC